MWDSNPQETDFEPAVSAVCNQPGTNKFGRAPESRTLCTRL